MENIKIAIPGTPEYRTMIRLITGSIATMAGFDVETADELKDCVYEACKLVSCHGQEGWSDRFIIDCNFEKVKVEVKVTDDCEAHTIKKVRKQCKYCPQEGDIGKVIIKSLMDEVEFGNDEVGHKFVKMVKEI